MIVKLNVKKGEKTWFGKVVNDEFKLDFIDGTWGKKSGELEFFIKEEGYYMGRSYGAIIFKYVYRNEDGTLNWKAVEKDEIIKSFFNFDAKFEKRDFVFTVVKGGPNGIAFDSSYEPIGDVFFAENENYYFISGKFLKKWKKYTRNFSRLDSMGEKKEVFEAVAFSKKKDNIKIVFRDEERIEITKPVFIDENSKFVPGFSSNLIGVLNT